MNIIKALCYFVINFVSFVVNRYNPATNSFRIRVMLGSAFIATS